MLNYVPIAVRHEYLEEHVRYVRFTDLENWKGFKGYAYEIPKERIEQALLLLDDPVIYELVDSEMLKDWEYAVKLRETELISEDLKHAIRVAYLVKDIPRRGVKPVSIFNMRSPSETERRLIMQHDWSFVMSYFGIPSETEGQHRLLALKYLGCEYFPTFFSKKIDDFPIHSKLPPMKYIACDGSSINTGFEKITAIFRLGDRVSADNFSMLITQKFGDDIGIAIIYNSYNGYSDVLVGFNKTSQLEIFRLAQQSGCKYKCFFVCKYEIVNYTFSPLTFGYFDSETPFQNRQGSDEIFNFDVKIFETAQSFAEMSDNCCIDVGEIFNLAINVDD